MKPTIIDDKIFEFEPFEEDGSVLLAAETSWRGMADELQELHHLKGAQFINQLKHIICYGEFRPVDGETNIFSAISEQSDDFDNLINAARKAVAHGNRVYILPNPRGIRTADFIFENKGIFKMYDLKTISGKASLENRLLESIDQTNHVLINVCTKYSPRLMAKQIRRYFQTNPNASEVLLYKGNKSISVIRRWTENPDFDSTFRRKYEK